jgi:hypothetical protein
MISLRYHYYTSVACAETMALNAAGPFPLVPRMGVRYRVPDQSVGSYYKHPHHNSGPHQPTTGNGPPANSYGSPFVRGVAPHQ